MKCKNQWVNLFGQGKVTAIDNGDTVVIKFNESDRYYEVSTDGNEVQGPIEIIFDSEPGVLDGEGTESTPFVIMSIEDLVEFSKNAINYKGKNVVLGKTLDFKSNLSYVDINTTNYDITLGGDGTMSLKEQLNDGLGFLPIDGFIGMFDGKNNWIKNININKETSNIIGVFKTSSNLTVQNLNISGKIIGKQNVGAFLGKAPNASASINIFNCNNYAYIKGVLQVGGIVGNGMGQACTKIENCNNYGTIVGIETSSDQIGGIIGCNGGISNSINYGSVSGTQMVGGICGSANSGEVLECVNEGNVKGKKYVGGICGHSGNKGIMERCYNIAEIKGTESVGGISGVVYRGGYIKCAYNSGDVIGEKYVGGIAGGDDGQSYNRKNISSNWYNVGKVTGNQLVGQLIGGIVKSTIACYEEIYYLSNSNQQGIGNITDESAIVDEIQIVEGKTKEELKSEEFLSILNEEHTHLMEDGTEADYTDKCWVEDSNNINFGYPIFSYQTQE